MFSHEIGISRVYDVLIVLELRQSENRQPILGTLRSTTATATKTSLQNVTLHNPKSFLFTSYKVGEIVLQLNL